VALTGRAIWVALAGLVPVVVRPGPSTFLSALAVLAAVVALDVTLAASPKRLTLTRSGPASVRLGEPARVELLVANGGTRRLRGSLRDGWQPSTGDPRPTHPLRLPPGERQRVVTTLRPTRRGDRLVDRVTIRSVGPLGIAARQSSPAAPGRLRVLPPFTSRRHLPSRLARLREIDGRTALRVRGQGTEFDSLRDYVVGDDVRSIDWRATARRQQVVVRTWRPERDRRVLLLLDTSRTSAARVGDAPRLDAAMDAALLFAALATRAGDHVDLLAMDRRVRARVQGASRTELLPALVEAMAPLDADLVEADWTGIVAAIRQTVPQRALVILLTSLESAAVDEGLLPVAHQLTSRHRVVVASVADPAIAQLAHGRRDAYAVYGAAAAERAELDRAATSAELSRLGVDVVDAAPADLPPRLADHYLALKAAGLL
jgi:uncharacterized protein (DUF58 family)